MGRTARAATGLPVDSPAGTGRHPVVMDTYTANIVAIRRQRELLAEADELRGATQPHTDQVGRAKSPLEALGFDDSHYLNITPGVRRYPY